MFSGSEEGLIVNYLSPQSSGELNTSSTDCPACGVSFDNAERIVADGAVL